MKQQTSLKDKIYEHILEDIIALEFKPNAILTEGFLMERYGCSKTPIREALHILCNENVLRNIPRCGYEVVSLTGEDIGDMLQYRYVLESGLLSMNLDSVSGEQIKRLEEINRCCTEADKDLFLHWKYNSEFHMTMLSFCNNPYASQELQKTLDRLRRAYAQLRCGGDGRSLAVDTQSHAYIIKALRDKSPERLRENLEKDLCDFDSAGINFLKLGKK